MRACIFFLLSLFITAAVSAQDKDKLFGGEAPKPRNGFIISGSGDFDIPAGDMAKRFGVSYRLGPAVLYKTTSNWLFGAKWDFIVGGTIKEDSLMINITDRYSAKSGSLYEFINNSGQRVGIPVYERGYAAGISVGKIIPRNKLHPDNGLTLLATVGFMQHRLNIFDKDKAVPQLRGALVKGYDRLTNGAFVEGYVGYSYFSQFQLVNFTIGIDALAGFTQGRRDYLYDVMHGDNKQRLDVLYGIRAGWFIPVFKRRSEDLLFE